MPDVLNKNELLDKVFGDVDLLIEIVDMFLELSPNMLNDIDHAIKARDAKGLSETAHTFKGSIGNFEQGYAFEAALELEKMGKSCELDKSSEAFKKLKQEVAVLEEALKSLKSETL